MREIQTLKIFKIGGTSFLRGGRLGGNQWGEGRSRLEIGERGGKGNCRWDVIYKRRIKKVIMIMRNIYLCF